MMQNLVEEYLSLVTFVVPFDRYGSRKAVNAYNRKVCRMREIAAEIEGKLPELKGEFFGLLRHENPEVRLWVAHHVPEMMECDLLTRKAALEEIRDCAAHDDGAQGHGNKLWLEGWYEKYPADRLL